MSRIYEALQRAEEERLAERHDNSGTAVLTPESRPTPPPPAPAPMPMPVEVAANSSTADSVFAEPPVAEPLISAPVIRTDIRETRWELSTDRFPALEQRGSMVEQFRSLRSRLSEFRAMNRLQSLLISSGLPQEGKSFIAANLALSLALHKNSKVLLIDGDMRRSTLQEYFGIESHPGLSDYLAGKAQMLDIMQRPSSASTPTRAMTPILNNLVIIPGGSVGDRAADLAGSPRFEELLRTAGPHFDWVIVDSSPVIPVSDSVSMARACDAVLLVARSGVTSYPVAQRAQHELKASNIIGFVLNAVKDPPTPDSYYTYDSIN